MFRLNSIRLSGREVLPLIEGGKGVGISNGLTAGVWAAAGGMGTFSGVNAQNFDENGNLIPIIYRGKTRQERHYELIQYAIKAGIYQAQMAYEKSKNLGGIHMNVLWEMGGVEPVLEGILEKAGRLIHGITCGAGMPYRLAEIAAKFKIFYVPIVSSARAFSALFQRSYKNFTQWLGGVVYEDPWRAGGHNGLSNKEDPTLPQDPYPRVLELRRVMNICGLQDVPLIMAGGVWHLRDWKDWIDNKEIGPIGFQFGTRPLLTQESPISQEWKRRLTALQPGDVLLNRFSPTGFYSSAVRNQFIQELQERSARQLSYSPDQDAAFPACLEVGARGRPIYLKEEDIHKALQWIEQGFTQTLKTPQKTVIFVTPEKALAIHKDQIECMGCLSACAFSNWDQAHGSTGLRPDPRSFCIQKTLQDIIHNGSIEDNLMFAGHNVFMFGQDPFYANGFIPTVQELVERICTGD